MIYLQNYSFMLQIEQNKQLAASFPRLKYWGESHKYMTWSTAKKLLHIPANRSDRYGKQSARCNRILDWNKFKNDLHGINQDELSNAKPETLIKDHISNKYWKIYETFVISNSAYMLCPVYFLLFFSFFFFVFSIPSISILRFFFILSTLVFFVYIGIDYTLKQFTPYNLQNKFYSTLVTHFN